MSEPTSQAVEALPPIHTRTLPRYPAELIERAYRLFAKGTTQREIGIELDVPIKTVSGWMQRYKWRARRAAVEASGQPDTSATNDAGEATPSPFLAATLTDSELAQSFGETQADARQRWARQALRMTKAVEAMPTAQLIGCADKVAKVHQTVQKALDMEKSKPKIVVNVGLLARSQANLKASEPVLLAEGGEQALLVESITTLEPTGFEPVEAPTSA